jgi:hypothetical protein
LVDMISSGKEDAAFDQFREDASNRPDIYISIIANSKNDFGCTIVASDN